MFASRRRRGPAVEQYGETVSHMGPFLERHPLTSIPPTRRYGFASALTGVYSLSQIIYRELIQVSICFRGPPELREPQRLCGIRHDKPFDRLGSKAWLNRLIGPDQLAKSELHAPAEIDGGGDTGWS